MEATVPLSIPAQHADLTAGLLHISPGTCTHEHHFLEW